MTTRAFQEAAHAANVRIVAPDRPGYGQSTRQRGHLLKDWPQVAARIADHLEIKEFSVLGYSGGGPYAAACAAPLVPAATRSPLYRSSTALR
jgi:pimeloyl-ACP methyl ester carboxylesterase